MLASGVGVEVFKLPVNTGVPACFQKSLLFAFDTELKLGLIVGKDIADKGFISEALVIDGIVEDVVVDEKPENPVNPANAPNGFFLTP